MYNSVISDEALGVLLQEINKNIRDDKLNDLYLITPILIKEAVGNIKIGKSDVSYDFKSDAFINCIEALAIVLSFILNPFLYSAS